MKTQPCGHSAIAKNIDYHGGKRVCTRCRAERNALKRAARERIKAEICALLDEKRSHGEIAQITGASINTVRKISAEYIPAHKRALLSDPFYPSRALETAARVAGAKVSQLRLGWRQRELARARFAYMLAMHERGMAVSAIGRSLNRDHSTVIYGVDQAKYLVTRDTAFREIFEQVRAA